MDIMSRVRENEPLIHCMTHAITMNDSANAILAVGGSPTMASHPQEVEEIVEAADSLVVNLGMLLLVVGLVALVIMRRKNYKQAKADEPRVIHMDNGETFKSYYSK